MSDIDTSAEEKLLNDFFGPRCSDFEPECAGCVAWRAFDTMRAERDGLLRVVTDNHVALCRAEDAEAKLAKAVEALHFYADFYEAPNDGPWGVNSDDFGTKARALLAELEETE
jgi:hypothetical protein